MVGSLIPVTLTKIATKPEGILETMKIDTMFISIFLKGWCQKKNRNAFSLTEFFQPAIQIRQVFNSDLFGILIPKFRIRVNLDGMGENHYKKFNPPLSYFISHQKQYALCDSPSFFPVFISGLAKYWLIIIRDRFCF